MQKQEWQRFVAIGDSFTEGVGDPNPDSPGGLRGWADRVAEQLARREDFEYANLAIRGRLLRQIAHEQADAALALEPDLISVSAGGNDLIRPGADPDSLAEEFAAMAKNLRSGGATVVVFAGVDTAFAPVLARIRGRVAIYNENLRAIAAETGCIVADQWALRELQTPLMWTEDRLHPNPLGHHTVARMVLETLGAEHDLESLAPEIGEPKKWRQARSEDIEWARKHLVPWVVRRIRHQSSGDFVTAKRPSAQPYTLIAAEKASRDEA